MQVAWLRLAIVVVMWMEEKSVELAAGNRERLIRRQDLREEISRN
jgi:hypothetical protein